MALSRSTGERLFDAALEQEAAAAASRPSILERLREEERVRERNAAMRRAARAVPGGEETIATIDALVAGSPAAAPELARARTIGERTAVARSVASTLPLGIEAFDSFTREQELTEQNAPLRRALGGALANPIKRVPLGAKIQARPAPIEDRASGIIAPRQAIDAPPGPARRPPQHGLSEAEEQLFAEALAVELRQAAAGPPSVMAQVREELRRQAVDAALFEPELAREATFGGPSEYARLQTRRKLTEELTRQLAGLGGVEASGPLVPEPLVDVFKSRMTSGGDFTDEQLAYASPFSSANQTLAWWIALYETTGEQEKANALRNGGPLPNGTPDLVPDAVTDAFGVLVKQAERAVEFTTAQLTEAAREAGDAGQRFLGELSELNDLNRVEAFERLNQAILGGLTAQFELSPEGIAKFGLAAANPVALFDRGRALEGLAGNETYSGSDHFLLQALPEPYRQAFGAVLEDAVLASAVTGTLIGTGVGLAVGGAPGVAVGIVVGLVATAVLNDLSEEDSDLAPLFEGVRRDAKRYVNQLDVDPETRRLLEQQAKVIVEQSSALRPQIR